MLDVRERTLPSTIPGDRQAVPEVNESRYSTTEFVFLAAAAVVLPLTLSALGAMDQRWYCR